MSSDTITFLSTLPDPNLAQHIAKGFPEQNPQDVRADIGTMDRQAFITKWEPVFSASFIHHWFHDAVQKLQTELTYERFRAMAEKEGDTGLLFAEYEYQLSKHDWFYSMSDDPRVYRNGCQSHSRVQALRKRCEAEDAGREAGLWLKYAKSLTHG